MRYFIGKNTGKGFITHEDNKVNHIAGYPGDIWATDNWEWAHFRGLVEINKEEAQRTVDLAIYGQENPDGSLLEINLP